jgi:hypothetical protein
MQRTASRANVAMSDPEEDSTMSRTMKMSVPLVILGVTATAPALAQEASQERNMDAEHCVRISNIDSIDVINDRTLVFRMRGGSSYRNDLPRNCPGLDEDDALMYRSSIGQLCNIDIVTVLDDWGFGFAPGVSCSLGMFHPITEQTVEDLAQSSE